MEETQFLRQQLGTEIDVYLRLEYEPHPNVEPSYNTSPITISGTEPKQYTLEIPSQALTHTAPLYSTS